MRGKRSVRAVSATVLAVACLAGCVCAQTDGQERIRSFHSDITVRRDASMLVRETITVHAAGRAIKRGIYRDFPTRYKDPRGNRYTVGFDVVEVMRDGRPEPWHTRRMKNGVRVYIGARDAYLQPGDYVYTLAYETDWQVGFYPDHDELYWNVTGNGWSFPMESASATVRVEGVSAHQFGPLEAYTGPQGARGKAFSAEVTADGEARFSTAAPLGPFEGLTIVVPWPKGIVREPTERERLMHLLRSDWGALTGGIGVLVVFGYYMIAWIKVGKDPEGDVVIPRYEPPRGFSPAAVRFVRQMGFDHRTFAAAVINMAVKGYLSIVRRDGKYTLERAGRNKVPLSPEERKIAGSLLSRRGRITLEQKNHKRIRRAVQGAEKVLRNEFEKIYFVTNRRYFIPGLILSVLTILSVGVGYASAEALFMTVWLTVWSLAVVVLVGRALSLWRAVLFGGDTLVSLGGALSTSLFALPFLGFEVFGLWALTTATSYWVIGILVALVALNVLFYHLLKAPTMRGRRLLDQIEGFRMFLSVADRERLDMLHPPRMTPELFEANLPYALALGVEQQWAEQFAEELQQSGLDPEEYRPGWYVGTNWTAAGLGSFASSLGGSLSGAVSASSMAPGSSSGGGGGFSGGGGGGGGGGGW